MRAKGFLEFLNESQEPGTIETWSSIDMKHLLAYKDWLVEAKSTAELSAPVASGGAETLGGISDIDLGKPSQDWWAWGVGADFFYKTLEIAKRIHANSPKDLAEIVALEEKVRAQKGLKREDVDLYGWWVWSVMFWNMENSEKGVEVFGDDLSSYRYELYELLVSDQNNPYTSSWPWFFKKKYNSSRFYSLVDKQNKELAKKKGTDQADVAQTVSP